VIQPHKNKALARVHMIDELLRDENVAQVRLAQLQQADIHRSGS